MARWDCETGENVEALDVDAFLVDVVAVCRKHGMSLGHEDHQGAFQVYKQALPGAIDWLMDAQIASGVHI